MWTIAESDLQQKAPEERVTDEIGVAWLFSYTVILKNLYVLLYR